MLYNDLVSKARQIDKSRAEDGTSLGLNESSSNYRNTKNSFFINATKQIHPADSFQERILGKDAWTLLPYIHKLTGYLVVTINVANRLLVGKNKHIEERITSGQNSNY